MITKYCCLFIPIKLGCIIAAVIYMVLTLSQFLYIIFIYKKIPEAFATLWLLKCIFLSIAAVLLLICALKEERVCCILFLAFNISSMLATFSGLIGLAFTKELSSIVPVWLIVFCVGEHLFYIYMIPIGIIFTKVLKEQHLVLMQQRASVMNQDLSILVPVYLHGV